MNENFEVFILKYIICNFGINGIFFQKNLFFNLIFQNFSEKNFKNFKNYDYPCDPGYRLDPVPVAADYRDPFRPPDY